MLTTPDPSWLVSSWSSKLNWNSPERHHRIDITSVRRFAFSNWTSKTSARMTLPKCYTNCVQLISFFSPKTLILARYFYKCQQDVAFSEKLYLNFLRYFFCDEYNDQKLSYITGWTVNLKRRDRTCYFYIVSQTWSLLFFFLPFD